MRQEGETEAGYLVSTLRLWNSVPGRERQRLGMVYWMLAADETRHRTTGSTVKRVSKLRTCSDCGKLSCETPADLCRCRKLVCMDCRERHWRLLHNPPPYEVDDVRVL